jgi:hypothetical protein
MLYMHPIHELLFCIYKEKGMISIYWGLILSLQEFPKVKKRKNSTIIDVHTRTYDLWVHNCGHFKAIGYITDNREVNFHWFFPFRFFLLLLIRTQNKRFLQDQATHLKLMKFSKNTDFCFKDS